jgi:hypothetical protein
MNCELCGRDDLHGELGVVDFDTCAGSVILIHETSPRNWILCDSCNKLVCHSCCQHPETGYCNECIERYDLIVMDEEGRVL